MIKLSTDNDRILAAKLQEAGQDHLFSFWEDLDSHEQKELLAQIHALDLPSLLQWITQYRKKGGKNENNKVFEPCHDNPIPRDLPPRTQEEDEAEVEIGEKILRDGKLAIVLSAPSLTRTPEGSTIPLGMTPIGPISGKSLFQLHAEKLVALGKKFRSAPPILLVTSSSTHEQTLAHFQESEHFGLSLQDLKFLEQPTLPVLNRRGLILRKSKHELALASQGHGATLAKLLDPEILKRLKNRGIQHVLFFVVENPLVQLGDTQFIGRHVVGNYQVSSKFVTKESPDEDIGTFCHCNGLPTLIESTELSDSEQNQRREDGSLLFNRGTTHTHLFSVEFLKELSQEEFKLPIHFHDRVTPYIDKRGRNISPKKPNSISFKTYVGDVLSQAEKVLLFPVERSEEFSPLSKSRGDNHEALVQSDLSKLYTNWLMRAGATQSPGMNSNSNDLKVEISPLFALDAEDVGERVELPLTINSDLYVE